jgi:predicted RNA methylase
VAELGDFFVPTSFDAIDSLLAEHGQILKHINAISTFMTGKEMHAGFDYYARGTRQLYDRFVPDASRIFDQSAAKRALDADFWQRALNLTDVYNFMPHDRRKDWDDVIYQMQTPEFEENRVRNTLSTLLSQRMDFLSEKVDKIFQNLSQSHVTNQPQGFCKRSIVDKAFDPDATTLGAQGGYIHDLRGVIGRFMGRDEPYWNSTREILVLARRTPGKWIVVDGGSLAIKAFKKGTCHVEVHEDIAFRLNEILAHLYPTAIPHQYKARKKEQRQTKEVPLSKRSLPFKTLFPISEGNFYRHGNRLYPENTFALGASFLSRDKSVKEEVGKLIESIGGIPEKGGFYYTFDYNAGPVIEEILTFGEVPDRFSHQYYPTPETLAEMAVDLADIGPEDRCLEPSAGQGHIARFLPKGRTVCVEVSALHCTILKGKEFEVVHSDFLSTSTKTLNDGQQFNAIIMNPPFSSGRAKAHVQHAMSMLAPGGRLVAIVPVGSTSRWEMPSSNEGTVNLSRVYEDAFDHTGVRVQIVVYTRNCHEDQGNVAA